MRVDKETKARWGRPRMNLYTVTRAATALKVSRKWLRAYIKAGKLPTLDAGFLGQPIRYYSGYLFEAEVRPAVRRLLAEEKEAKRQKVLAKRIDKVNREGGTMPSVAEILGEAF